LSASIRLKCVLSTEAKSKAAREPQPNGFWDDLPMVPRFIAWVINAERYTTVLAALSPHAVAEETASRTLCVTSTNCYATLIDQPWIMSIARRNWVAAGHSF
jgi:hypothetical protein